MNSEILDQVTQQFITALQHDALIIDRVATGVFFYLATIQLALTALWMTVAGEPLARFFSRLLQLAFSLGVFYALIHQGGVWIAQLINGFVQLGQQTGVQSLDPSSIVDQGLSISAAILKGFFGWGLLGHPFVAIVGAVVCCVMMILYSLIAAELAITLVKAYILLSTGGLFFAFGASDFTHAMAKNYLNAVIGIGLYLMTLYFLIGVGQSIGSGWAAMTAQAAKAHSLMPMFVILAAVIVYYLTVKNIPTFIAGLSGVGGFRNYGDAAVGMAVNAGMGGVNAFLQTKKMTGQSVQGATQAGQTAMQLARSFSHGMQHSGTSNAVVSGFKTAGAHLAGASANTVKDMAMQRNTHLNLTQKLHHHLANRIKPQDPTPKR